MSFQDTSMNTSEKQDDTLEFPLQLSKLSLLNVRNDNTFISPIAIETALHALSINANQSQYHFTRNFPFYFYNYFILDQNSIDSLMEGLNERSMKYFHTEFQIHSLNDIEQRKTCLNALVKQFSDRAIEPIVLSQKIFGQTFVEPMTLISCSSLVFRPFKSEYWEQVWSLKFHPNAHLALETEFYFTKGFFRVAFHDTLHKIEIPGQIFDGIQLKLVLLLPRCSSDLVHIYANIQEYLNLPFSSAFIGVCIPNISMDIDLNLMEALKTFHHLYDENLVGQSNEEIHRDVEEHRTSSRLILAGARFFGHFSLDMNRDPVEQSSHCLHTIDLSPVTPWVFFANRPFLFLITSGDSYLLIGQMLGPSVRQETFRK